MFHDIHPDTKLLICELAGELAQLFTYTESDDPEIARLQKEAAKRLLAEPVVVRESPIRCFGETEARPYYREPSEWTQGFWERYHAKQDNKVDISAPRYVKPEVLHVPRAPIKRKSWDYHATHDELFLDEIKEAIRYNCGSEVDLRCLDVMYLHETDPEWEV